MKPVRAIISWVKHNKLATLLLLFFIYIFGRPMFNNFYYSRSHSLPYSADSMLMLGTAERMDTPMSEYSIDLPRPNGNTTPNTSTKRIVVKNSNISMVVKDVSETVKLLTNHIEKIGGFMITSNLSNPDEVASADLTFRVPSDTLDQTLEYFKSLSVKVVSEKLIGTDVTDQFEDINEKLRILRSNKSRMITIMNQATEVSDIVSIQQQVFNIQSQIDSLVGRQKAILKTSQFSKVTVYLSTDEFSLPYTPDEPWRPDVVFKRAVRSLVRTFQSIGSLGIWLVVYSVLIVPVIFVIIVIKKSRAKKHTPAPVK